MSFRKTFILFTVSLFIIIGVAGFLKKDVKTIKNNLNDEVETNKNNVCLVVNKDENVNQDIKICDIQKESEKIDKIRRFFSKGNDKFPIVETITYTSRVFWLKGRPAWIADYATYYETSRHFIARGLNNKIDYLTQNVAPGDKFNVFVKDKNIKFYLIVDLEKCDMDFYYLDLDVDERVFVKNYKIGVGRLDNYSPSGSLTPIGKYTIGNKVAIYDKDIEHYFQNKKTKMVEVFGTRWLPFDKEIENCSDSAKGYGLHGMPMRYDDDKCELVEIDDCVGGYNSDGCLRLKKDDIEELFSIIITKPTIIEIVKNKKDLTLPMSRESNSL